MSDGSSADGFRRRSASVADWVRNASFLEQGRADVRAMLREARQGADTDSGVSDPSFMSGLGLTTGPRPGGSWSSVGSISTRRLGFHMQSFSYDTRSSEDDESVTYLNAVGPPNAGDPLTGLERHRCELPEDQNLDPYPALPPHPSRAERFQRRVLPFIMLSPRHPYTHRMLRSLALIREEQSRHAHSRHWYIIHPLSLTRLWFERILSVMIFSSLMMVPYQLAFFKDIGAPYGAGALTHPFLVVWSSMVHLVDLTCLLDCLLHFFTGYFVAHENVTVLHPRLIARRYLRSTFIVDFIPNLPHQFILTPIPQDDVEMVVMVLHLLRLVRVWRLIEYSKTWFTVKYCPKIFRRSLRFCILGAVYVQWMSLSHWFVPLAFFGREDLFNRMGAGNGSWMVVTDIIDSPRRVKYLHCVYRAFMIGFLVGLPHAPPHITVEYVLIAINALSGLALYACCFVWVMFLVLGRESNMIVYEQVMIMVREYANYKQLSDDLRERLFRFYECSLESTFFREVVIHDNLSRHLQTQVLQHACREAVRSSGLFHGLPRAVCTELVSFLKPVMLLRGDVFMREGDVCNGLYFVHYGALALVTENGVEAEHLKDGDHFGEIEMLNPLLKCTSTVVVLETTELLRLERRAFQHIFFSYPPLLFRLKRRAEKRMERLRVASEYSGQPSYSPSVTSHLPL